MMLPVPAVGQSIRRAGQNSGLPNTAMPLTRVAVCLAAFNGVRWLDEQIDSILLQAGVELRIFVSVDQSVDGTEDAVDKRAALDDRISVLPHGSRFGSAAQNFFRLLRDVDFSSFSHVAFADQDDIWHADKLRHSIEVLHTHRAAGMSTNVTAFWPDGREMLIRKDQPMGKWNHLFESAGPGCTYVLTEDMASQLGAALRRTPERAIRIALHDWLVFAWVRSHGGQWCIDSTATIRYRQHESNEFGANRGLGAALSRWRKLTGGWYRLQVLAVADFVDQGSAEPVQRLRRLSAGDRWTLVRSVGALRRRGRDRLVLGAALLLMNK